MLATCHLNLTPLLRAAQRLSHSFKFVHVGIGKCEHFFALDCKPKMSLHASLCKRIGLSICRSRGAVDPATFNSVDPDPPTSST
ncbi:hypothetical protein KCU62_g492, partial [Aureobasidium sp. EXF-3399]